MKIQKKNFFFLFFFGGGGRVGGLRVDVNREVKLGCQGGCERRIEV